MAALFAYICSCCGQRHEGSPSFGYVAPDYYDALSEPRKRDDAQLTSDVCVIRYDDATDYFARVMLEIPIVGVDDPFLWGVWVSLSEKSFERYTSTWKNADESDRWFGWFSSRLPYYPDTTNLKTTVRPRNGGKRPAIELELTDHPLSQHYHNGISRELAQEIAEFAMHRIAGNAAGAGP